MTRYFSNPEIKKLSIVFILIFIVFMSLGGFLFKLQSDNLNRNYIKQNTLIVGNIIKNHPELEKEVVSSLNMEDYENYELGKNILSKYSYDENLSLYKNPVIDRFYKGLLSTLGIGMISFIICVFATSFLSFIGVYKRIDEFSIASEDIMDGRFKKFEDENREGDFYILASKFNLMSNRLKESMDNLKKEKIFLKNIISDISHQLKTPLSSLIMFNDIMKGDIPEKDRRNFLNLSDEQLKRMEWLIINLLKVGRLEAGVVEFKIKENPLLITINKSLGGLLDKAKENEQSIIIDVDESTCFKHDTEWTAEAISNIIKNAIEHIGEKGKIVISSEETPISLSISIKDNGPGIPRALQNKVFQRFYKGENSINPASVGIGLSLSKSIIESQNGTIRVESEKGKGTEFIITFLKTVI
ncbi:HAMP domain-containing sensor histidine kinase [Hathewaya histolytica]|uniref:histidine kinase n=1 Tax=Hathewaya histolytica TaxID=1498 RepID=A0A4U9R055_HATHI|nr:HAMP domain-containing sensor histidine kinase [Hathewaya histolytica]VTQ82050.1 sensor histidine kinase [Hathewaya histolytica]